MMKHSTSRRKGMTLLELLVVATIILMVTAISVPVLKPMMQSQLTNNASAVVSTYLNRARSRAIQTGRPCGVSFEVWPGTEQFNETLAPIAGASLVLRQVEVPPAYAGMTGNETASVNLDENGNPILASSDANGDWYSISFNDDYWSNFIVGQNSAKIQLDHSGPFYRLNKDGNAILAVPGVQISPKQNVSFKIMRDPKPTMTAPVGLPQGTVVDLSYSGIDGDLVQPGVKNVTIMFLPNGGVDRITGLGLNDDIPDSTIYFMIGRWDRIDALPPPDDGLKNYQDGTNFWVTVNPQNGTISTIEMNTEIDSESTDSVLYQSRNFARQSQRNIGAY